MSYAFPGRPAVRERYHFASVAIDFARHLALAGLAQKIRVTRLADAAVLYDSAELIELPERQW
ncbi:MAG: hypothetical protein GEV11_04475 [Streptosporangiales bacterium]|nr:hypothetical protein [Streptosporangiales bacterium]